MTEKLLVIGAGFLGNAVISVAKESSLATSGTRLSNTHQQLDIRDMHAIEKIIQKLNPDYIVNCAVSTDIDNIEINPTLAYQVNSIGAQNIAKITAKNKIRFIHISTDSVFDGTKNNYSESDMPNPINEYAKSKKLGEDLIRDSNDFATVIRTNFYGYDKGNKFLFNWILNNLKRKKSFSAFSDVIFNPLEVNNLAYLIIEILTTDLSGIVHLSGDEILSKYQFAYKVANTLNYDTSLVLQRSIFDSNLIAKRPLNTSLSNSFAKTKLRTKIIPLEEWLRKLPVNVL